MRGNKLPSLNWPIISYPTASSDGTKELEQVSESLRSGKSSNNAVAAIVVDPFRLL